MPIAPATSLPEVTYRFKVPAYSFLSSNATHHLVKAPYLFTLFTLTPTSGASGT